MSSHREAPEISKDPVADSTDVFQFTTALRNPDTFLYNTGLACPPCNIGPLSTPRYATLAASAVHSLPGGVRVFAGQRAEGFYVDLGSIFDLATLRPFQQLHAKYGMHVFSKPEPGVNTTNELNVHSIALQVPIAELTGSSSRDESDPRAVIGVWTSASRRHVQVWDADRGLSMWSGPYRQVSRLGNPLVNEVLIPLGKKDFWNTQPPMYDSDFASYVAHPELAGLLPPSTRGCSRIWRRWISPGSRARTWRPSC
ncbi:MAG: DUF4331 domain-containing protein [Streptosporangiaceae bacterium]